jgi:porin
VVIAFAAPRSGARASLLALRPFRIWRSAAVVATALVASLASPASAEEETWRTRPQLVGDPGGWRSRLDDSGVILQGLYNQSLAWKPTGGAQDGSEAGHSASYDLFTYVDGEILVGWVGLTGLLHVKGQYDENINDETGSLSPPIDDADFDEGIYVDELWLQQSLFDNRLRLRAGFLEQQTTFDRNAFANSEDRQFLTTFLDNNGIVPLPNGFGANLIVAPWRWLELAVGVADADNRPTKWGASSAFDGFDSLTSHFELTLRVAGWGPHAQLPGTYRLGAFRDGRDRTIFERVAAIPPAQPTQRRGHWGFYASFDQTVYTDPSDRRRAVGVFARVGYVDEDTSSIEWFWSTGLQVTGPLIGRENDVLGLGVYQAIASDAFQDTRSEAFDEETGFELYYRIAVLGWLAVTPDFQYILSPGPSGEDDDAVIAALRLRVTF